MIESANKETCCVCGAEDLKGQHRCLWREPSATVYKTGESIGEWGGCDLWGVGLPNGRMINCGSSRDYAAQLAYVINKKVTLSNLINAAPDMLAALELYVAEIEDLLGDMEPWMEKDQPDIHKLTYMAALAAIAKAKGKK